MDWPTLLLAFVTAALTSGVVAALTLYRLSDNLIEKAGAAIKERVRAAGEVATEQADALNQALIDLRSERARVMGTIRAAKRARGEPEPEPDDDDQDDGQGGDLGDAAGFLAGLAQQAGVDVQKVMAGDMAEIQRGLAALKAGGGEQTPAQAAEQGWYL